MQFGELDRFRELAIDWKTTKDPADLTLIVCGILAFWYISKRLALGNDPI